MGLTLQYIPYEEVGNLSVDEKLRKILKSVKENKIIFVEGRLNANEETLLIKKTMEMIDKKFKGIEICSIKPQKRRNNEIFGDKLRKMIANFLIGKNDGLTIVGPATIIKEIKRDPNKIELLTKDVKIKGGGKK